jgi:molybdopterin-synthase adenylyltransferase
MNEASEQFARYRRQMILPQIGESGQARLAAARLLLVGCGALGCHAADQLARAGVGHLRIADRDVVELTNLGRQTLFDEQDAKAGYAKAQAAAQRLAKVNSAITIEPLVTDVWAGNVEELAQIQGRPADLILDGTDNVQTRYLLNDIAVKAGIPWIMAACVGTEGRVMAIDPGRTACLRCVFPTPPAGGELPTCDTAGILQPAAAMVASLQVAQAMKMLIGQWQLVDQRLWTLDVWSGRFGSIGLAGARQTDCPCCGQREFPFLQTNGADAAVTLCGRNAVQIRPARPWKAPEFERAIGRLGRAGQVESGIFFSRCRLDETPGMTITCFKDGRLLIDGTADTGRAKAVCARYIGT